MTEMPTRTDTRYRVLLVAFNTNTSGYVVIGKPEDGTRRNLFPTPEDAREYGDGLLAAAKSSGIIYSIKREEVERTAAPEECSDDELRQAWQVWGELQDAPKQYDPMDVADPYLNYPGDMEGYSDYFADYANEFARRHEDEDPQPSISDRR